MDLHRSDGQRPDGESIVPWKCGKELVWGCHLYIADVHLHHCPPLRSCGNHFVPVAIETLVAMGTEALAFHATLSVPQGSPGVTNTYCSELVTVVV